MPDVRLAPVANGAASRSVDRRTLLVGAAGALAAAGLSGPARAAGSASSLAARAGPRFDPDLARDLQRGLRDALGDPGTTAPGAVLHVRSPRLGRWIGVAGLGRVAPDVPMRRADRFRAGSIVKPFVSVVVLQLAERGRLSLDARLPEVLPADVVARFPTAQPPVFAPGTGFFYSNTNYNLLGLIIERITGRSWRYAVTRRVIRPLRLTRTDLPAPGDPSIKAQHAHGYAEFEGKTIDITRADPSFAGAAGASALVTTVQDLARFLDALFRGRLFRRRATLRQMLDLAPAQGEGGLAGYGLGIEQYALPEGIELVGHLGGTAGYRSFVGRVRPLGDTIAFALNAQDDPTPLVIPVVEALAATHR